MKRGDLTDDELRECIMAMPTFDGIDDRLIDLFIKLVARIELQISKAEFKNKVMNGLYMRHKGLQEKIRNEGAKNIHGLLYKTIGFAIKDLLRKKITVKIKKVAFDADITDDAEMPYESTEQRCEESTEKFDLADEALAINSGKYRCGFLIAYKGIERPLEDERAEIQTGGADIFKRRLAHADRPTVGEVSASATKLSAHNKGKWTMDMLVEAFNHAADSANLCPNAVTGRKWNSRIKVACKNAQSILNKDC